MTWEWWSVVPGVLLVLVALRDVFHTLWHPSGKGEVSGALQQTMWTAARRLRGGAGSTAGTLVGPSAVVATIGLWIALLVTGWALVYWPFLGDGFVYSSGLDAGDRQGLLDALYVSTVVLATLGFGDIVPSDGWLRLVTAGQALVGFSMLTAAVSWLIQLESTVSRRRGLARYVSQLRRALDRTEQVPGPAALDRAAAELARVRVDLSHASVTYYFTDADEDAALVAGLPWLVRAAQDATRAEEEATRTAADTVLIAVDDLLALVDAQFLHGDGSRETSLRAFGEQHGYPVAA